MGGDRCEGNYRDRDKGEAPFAEGGGYGEGGILGWAAGREGHMSGDGSDIQGERKIMRHLPC